MSIPTSTSACFAHRAGFANTDSARNAHMACCRHPGRARAQRAAVPGGTASVLAKTGSAFVNGGRTIKAACARNAQRIACLSSVPAASPSAFAAWGFFGRALNVCYACGGIIACKTPRTPCRARQERLRPASALKAASNACLAQARTKASRACGTRWRAAMCFGVFACIRARVPF